MTTTMLLMKDVIDGLQAAACADEIKVMVVAPTSAARPMRSVRMPGARMRWTPSPRRASWLVDVEAEMTEQPEAQRMDGHFRYDIDPADPRTWFLAQLDDRKSWIGFGGAAVEIISLADKALPEKILTNADNVVKLASGIAAYYGLTSVQPTVDTYNAEAEAGHEGYDLRQRVIPDHRLSRLPITSHNDRAGRRRCKTGSPEGGEAARGHPQEGNGCRERRAVLLPVQIVQLRSYPLLVRAYAPKPSLRSRAVVLPHG